MTDIGLQLTPGDLAPDFALHDANGELVTLAGLRGARVIVYFYPAAFTPGCTTEACDFRDNLASLQSAGYTVLGISPDPLERLAEFAVAEQLAYPLLSDPDAAVAKAWGAWGEKTIEGRTFDGVLRATIVLDERGEVAHAEYRVDAEGHVARLRAQLNGA